MTKLQTHQDVDIDEVCRRLSNDLGPRYRVTMASDAKLKVGRTGVIPSQVTLRHTNDGTTFDIHSTGLIVSRLIQVALINPRVKRALSDAYANGSPE
jgi:hypothetical protein